MPFFRLSLCLLAAGAAGCQSDGDMRELDRKVSRMITQMQGDALHQPGLDDPAPVSGAESVRFTGRAEDGAWEKTPATNNPGANSLEARTDPKGNLPPVRHAGPLAAKLLDFDGLLGQAIATAPEYRTAKENLMIAALALVIERHAWGPRFFADVSTNLTGVPEAGDHDTAANLIGTFGATQKLPYGGELSASVLSTFTSYLAQQAGNTAFPDSQNSQLNLGLTLPLLRGSGRVAQASLVQGERNLVYAARDFETFRRNLMVGLAGSYFGLLQSQKVIENQKKRLASLEDTSLRLHARVAAGSAAPIDADYAALQAQAAKTQVAAAEDAYRDQIDQLKVRLGLPLETPLDLLAKDIQVPVPELDLPRALAQARAARLDLQTSRDRVDDAARQAEVARDSLRGDLAFTAASTLNTDPTQRYGGAVPKLGASTYATGLKYSLPLDRVNEESTLRQSVIGIEQARRARDTFADGIEANVRSAIRNIERARLTLVLQEENIALAARRLEQTKLKERELGFRPILDAENDLLDARNNRDQAVTDLRLSVLRYLNETGQIRVDAGGHWVPPGKLVPLERAARGAPDAAAPPAAGPPPKTEAKPDAKPGAKTAAEPAAPSDANPKP